MVSLKMGLESAGHHIDRPDDKPEVQRVNWDLTGLLTRDNSQRSTDLFGEPAKPGKDKPSEPSVSVSIGGMVADKGSAPILSNTASMYVSLDAQHKAFEQSASNTSAQWKGSNESSLIKADCEHPAGEGTGWKTVSFNQSSDKNKVDVVPPSLKDDAAKGSSTFAGPSEAQNDHSIFAKEVKPSTELGNVGKAENASTRGFEPEKPDSTIARKIELSDKITDASPAVLNTKSLDVHAIDLVEASKAVQNNKPAEAPQPAVSPVPEKSDLHIPPIASDKPAIDQTAIRKADSAPSTESVSPKLNLNNRFDNNRNDSPFKTINNDVRPTDKTVTDRINPILIVSSVAIVSGGPVGPIKPADGQTVKPNVIVAPPVMRDVFIPTPQVVAPRPVESRPVVSPSDTRPAIPPVTQPDVRSGAQPPRVVAPVGDQAARPGIQGVGADQTPRVPTNNAPGQLGDKGRTTSGDNLNSNTQRNDNAQGRQLTVASNPSIALGGNEFKSNLRDFTKEAATLAQIYTRSPQAVITSMVISAQREISDNKTIESSNVQRTVDVPNAKSIRAVIKPGDNNRPVQEPQANLINNQSAKVIAALDQPKVRPIADANTGRSEQTVAQAIPGNNRLIGSIADRQVSNAQNTGSFIKDKGQSGAVADNASATKPGAFIGRPLSVSERLDSQFHSVGQGALNGFEAARNAGIKYEGAFAAFMQGQKAPATFDINSRTGMGLQAVQQSWNAAIAAGAAHASDSAKVLNSELDPVKKYAQHITQRMEEAIRRVSEPSSFVQKSNDAGVPKKNSNNVSEMFERNQKFADGFEPVDQPAAPAGEDSSSPFHSQAFIIALLLSIGGLTRGRFANADLIESGIASGFNDEEPSARPLGSNRRRRTHMVEGNETLQSIAEKYYGDARVAWLIADLNSPIEHKVEDGRVVELKTRQLLELPEILEAKAFIRSLPREFDINKLTTIVTDTMINLEVLQSFLGAMNLKEDNSFGPREFVLPALTICAE